jgi:hypothetical protein
VPLHDVDPHAVACERHVIAIGVDARSGYIVDDAAKFAQAPTKRAPRIVGDVPEQRAEAVAAMRPAGEGEIREERPRFFRRRKVDALTGTCNFDFAQETEL